MSTTKPEEALVHYGSDVSALLCSARESLDRRIMILNIGSTTSVVSRVTCGRCVRALRAFGINIKRARRLEMKSREIAAALKEINEQARAFAVEQRRQPKKDELDKYRARIVDMLRETDPSHLATSFREHFATRVSGMACAEAIVHAAKKEPRVICVMMRRFVYNLKLREVGEEFGISPERARQIVFKGIRRIRHRAEQFDLAAKRDFVDAEKWVSNSGFDVDRASSLVSEKRCH